MYTMEFLIREIYREKKISYLRQARYPAIADGRTECLHHPRY